jgi:hypothetical protein
VTVATYLLGFAFGVMLVNALVFREQREVLIVLARNGGWMRGLDIVRQSDGRVHRGVVYVALNALEARGVVDRMPDLQDEWDGRKLYRLPRGIRE